jgi:hypothetical protein
MVPPIDDRLHNEDVDTSPVLLWIHPTETESLNGVSILVPGVDSECHAGEYWLCSDARATPYIVPGVPEMKEKSESLIDNFPFVKPPFPNARRSLNNVISEIDFHWPVKTGTGKYLSTTGLLVVPLPLPNSCHPKPPVETGKANISSKCRQARWLSLDLIPSSGALETREIIDDQNTHGLSPQKVKSE